MEYLFYNSPWSFCSGVYSTKIVCEVNNNYPTDESELDFASLGKSKEVLDRIELTLPLEIWPFRHLVHFCDTTQPVRIDAFALMMSSQKQLSQQNTLTKISCIILF